MQLALPHVHTHHPRCTVLQQAVGEAAGGLAHVQAARAGHVKPRGGQRTLQLETAARDVARLGRVQQLDLGAGRQVGFTVSTQSVPFQRVQVVGTRGRIEGTFYVLAAVLVILAGRLVWLQASGAAPKKLDAPVRRLES